MRNNPALLMSFIACAILTTSCKELQQYTKLIDNPTFKKSVDIGTQASEMLMPIGWEDELVIGQAISLQVVSRYGGVVDNPSLTDYVSLVGQAVANTSDRPNISYHFAILNHNSINAFAAPGGYIFVTRGLLNQVNNEAELAGVLGHEIAHVSQKHVLDIIQRSKQLAGAASFGFSYFKQDPAKFKGIIDEAVKKLLDEGLDQGKETEADQLGDIFAARVGYDPNAYVTLLTRLRTVKGDDLAFFKTHPNFSSRIQAVQQTIQEKRLKSNGMLLNERYIKAIKQV